MQLDDQDLIILSKAQNPYSELQSPTKVPYNILCINGLAHYSTIEETLCFLAMKYHSSECIFCQLVKERTLLDVW